MKYLKSYWVTVAMLAKAVATIQESVASVMNAGRDRTVRP